MSNFSQHYSRLHDEDLIDLALRGDLLPEAASALNSELTKRGINNLDSHRQAKQEQMSAEALHREVLIAQKEKSIVLRARFLYVVAACFGIYGLYGIFFSNIGRAGGDGGSMLMLGIAIFVLAKLQAWLSRIWSERVLHRAPPP